MFKKLCMFLTAMLLSASVFASSAQAERQEVCSFIAEYSSQAASAKVLGMDAPTFQSKMVEFTMMLLSRGVPPDIVTEMVMSMNSAYIEGLGVAATLEKYFAMCMARKAT
jgi:hypothetical protein